jgi:hypothetical protein
MTARLGPFPPQGEQKVQKQQCTRHRSVPINYVVANRSFTVENPVPEINTFFSEDSLMGV